jgi:hypothetical protein
MLTRGITARERRGEEKPWEAGCSRWHACPSAEFCAFICQRWAASNWIRVRWALLTGLPRERGDFCPPSGRRGKQRAHLTTYPMDNGAGSPWISQSGREADHSRPSSAEVKNACEVLPPLPHPSSRVCLIKHTDNFTVLLFAWICVVNLMTPSASRSTEWMDE